MAKKGALGTLSWGDTPAVVGELRSWRYADEPAEIDTTVMGTGNARFQPGARRHQVEIEVFFEYADAGQALIIAQNGADTPQDIQLRPQGAGSGLPELTGKTYVLGYTTEAAADGAIEMTATLPSDENGLSWAAQV